MKRIILDMFLLCGILLAVASCTEEEETMGQAVPLTMDITVNGSGSRAIIENGTLPDGTFVGVTVVDAGGSTYNDINYNNLMATVSGTSLNLDSEVMITDTDATIYGYYPWASGVSETAVPLVAGETDYLYATPITGVNNGNASATLSMNHALACLRVSINRGDYSGTGALSTLSITSDALSTTGTLNARTGTVTATGTGVYETNLSQTIGDATITKDIMVVPSGTAGDITFSILVDGNEYFVTGPSITLQSGSIYEYNIEIELSPWSGLANGVYAVAADGSPVEAANADNSCIAVALITDNQKIMIATENATDGTYSTLCWGYNLYDKNVAGITETTDATVAKADFEGAAHTAAIIAAYTEHSVEMNSSDMCKVLQDFNAGDSNKGYKDWYIPALGQLYEMYANVSAINTMLTAISGTNIITSGDYLSSSEYSSEFGWYVYFNGGNAGSYGKYSYNRVRFVRDIK